MGPIPNQGKGRGSKGIGGQSHSKGKEKDNDYLLGKGDFSLSGHWLSGMEMLPPKKATEPTASGLGCYPIS